MVGDTPDPESAGSIESLPNPKPDNGHPAGSGGPQPSSAPGPNFGELALAVATMGVRLADFLRNQGAILALQTSGFALTLQNIPTIILATAGAIVYNSGHKTIGSIIVGSGLTSTVAQIPERGHLFITWPLASLAFHGAMKIAAEKQDPVFGLIPPRATITAAAGAAFAGAFFHDTTATVIGAVIGLVAGLAAERTPEGREFGFPIAAGTLALTYVHSFVSGDKDLLRSTIAFLSTFAVGVILTVNNHHQAQQTTGRTP